MRVLIGQHARPFRIQDATGRVLALSDYQGRPVLLSFFRSVSCPLCSMQVWYLAQHYARLRQYGIKVLAIFESPEPDVLDYIGSLDPPFTLIADPERKLFAEYAVESSWLGWVWGLPRFFIAFWQARWRGIGGWMASGQHTRLPADFLIAPDQTIQYAYYGRHIADRIALDTLEQILSGDASD